jgi:uncharacterized protein (TIGR00251 family)
MDFSMANPSSETVPVATRKSGGILLHIHVQPKSAANAMAGLYKDALKVRLTAPPADGAANRMCVKFLAKQLGLPPSDIEIVSGHTARHKQVFIRIQEKLPSESDRLADTILKKIATWTICKR